MPNASSMQPVQLPMTHLKRNRHERGGDRRVSERTPTDFEAKETKAWNEYRKTVEGAVKHYYEVTRIGLKRLDKGERLVIRQKEPTVPRGRHY
jgi:hypothetical protein